MADQVEKKIFRLPNKYFVFLCHLHIGGNISGDRRLGLGLSLIWVVLIKYFIISPNIK